MSAPSDDRPDDRPPAREPAAGADAAAAASPRAGTPPPLPPPGCLGPLPPPLRAPRRPARTWLRSAALAVALACGSGFVVTLVDVPRDRWYVETQRPVRNVPKVAGARRTAPAATPSGRLEQLVGAIHRSVRTATQRQQRTRLRTIDPAAFAAPRDFRLYGDQVATVVDDRVWSPARAIRLERLGRIAFVAGVVMLHELDYEDARDCRRAANLHRLLGQMVAVDGLATVAVGDRPSELDTCRFLAIADGWRRIAEQFAADDAVYAALLDSRGKGAGGQR